MVSDFYLNLEFYPFVNTLIAVFSLLYLVWPLIFIFGLRHLLDKDLSITERLRKFINRVFLAWLLWAFFLWFIDWQGRQPVLLLSKQVNHVLFFGTGIVFAVLTVAWLIYRWRNRWIRLAEAQELEDLLAMSPEDFEALVAALFRSYGHQAEVCGGSADHGVDVIVHTDQGETWVVQCKRYSGSVGEPVLRDLYGTMTHESAQKAYLITTGSFTAQAATWAEGKPIVLYDGEALVKLIRRTQRRTPKLRR